MNSADWTFPGVSLPVETPTRRGRAWLGLAGQGWAGRGRARHGRARPGWARRGEARAVYSADWTFPGVSLPVETPRVVSKDEHDSSRRYPHKTLNRIFMYDHFSEVRYPSGTRNSHCAPRRNYAGDVRPLPWGQLDEIRLEPENLSEARHQYCVFTERKFDEPFKRTQY